MGPGRGGEPCSEEETAGSGTGASDGEAPPVAEVAEETGTGGIMGESLGESLEDSDGEPVAEVAEDTGTGGEMAESLKVSDGEVPPVAEVVGETGTGTVGKSLGVSSDC